MYVCFWLRVSDIRCRAFGAKKRSINIHQLKMFMHVSKICIFSALQLNNLNFFFEKQKRKYLYVWQELHYLCTLRHRDSNKCTPLNFSSVRFCVRILYTFSRTLSQKYNTKKINISPLKSSSFCIHSVCKTFTFELFNGLLFPCVSHHIVT